LETVGETAMSYAYEVGDLVVTTTHASLDYGIGVIVEINFTKHGSHTYLISFPKKGFRQWRGHNELRRLQ
jgi:hypothetical protein